MQGSCIFLARETNLPAFIFSASKHSSVDGKEQSVVLASCSRYDGRLFKCIDHHRDVSRLCVADTQLTTCIATENPCLALVGNQYRVTTLTTGDHLADFFIGHGPETHRRPKAVER